MAWQWCHFLLASCRKSAATDHLCQIMLNLKLLHNSEKRCKFSSHNKKKLRKSKIIVLLLRIRALNLTPWTMLPYFWSKLAKKAYRSCHKTWVCLYFHWSPHVRCSVYSKPKSQICAQLQPHRTQQKILSHTTELTCPRKTWPLQPSVFFNGINCLQVINT